MIDGDPSKRRSRFRFPGMLRWMLNAAACGSLAYHDRRPCECAVVSRDILRWSIFLASCSGLPRYIGGPLTLQALIPGNVYPGTRSLVLGPLPEVSVSVMTRPCMIACHIIMRAKIYCIVG